jgi:hypothetical protein
MSNRYYFIRVKGKSLANDVAPEVNRLANLGYKISGHSELMVVLENTRWKLPELPAPVAASNVVPMTMPVPEVPAAFLPPEASSPPAPDDSVPQA